MTPSLLKTARKSTHSTFFHGVQVKRGGAVVASGYNHGTTHAEIHALKKLWPDHRKGVTVVSIRVTRSGKLSMAKPCDNCELWMRRAGVKKVIYSDGSGKIQTMILR